MPLYPVVRVCCLASCEQRQRKIQGHLAQPVVLNRGCKLFTIARIQVLAYIALQVLQDIGVIAPGCRVAGLPVCAGRSWVSVP